MSALVLIPVAHDHPWQIDVIGESDSS